MLRIGKPTSFDGVAIDAPFFQAGLAGYSDAAMRLVARRHGAPYAVTEAMLDVFLINGGKGLQAAELDAEDHPIAGQLMGSHPAEIAAGAKMLVKLGYDVIDVNLACPVKKIRRKARGGHLLQEPEAAIAILDAVRQAVPADVPCSVKLRRGSDDSPQAEANFHRIFEAVVRLGYAAATVHGRTVEQKYLGPSRWEFLRELVARYGNPAGTSGDAARRGPSRGGAMLPSSEACPSLGETDRADDANLAPSTGDTLHRGSGTLIFGSGDIWTAADIFHMIRQTGVAAVSVARGCIGNPWIFTQARALLAGDEAGGTRPPTIAQQRDVLLEHFELSVRLHGEFAASRMMRKFGIKFSRHHPQGPEIARAFVAVRSLEEWRAVLERYYGADGPGAAAAMDQRPQIADAERCDAVAEEAA